jgi:aminopeptidase 2
LWLNEGFATFVGWAATHHVFPEWKVWSFFIADETFKGLSLDAMNSSHPIQVDVSSPSQIGEIFDAISYSKGGALIRMLCDFLGPEKFSRGISQYLKKHQYGNANTLDLWSALEECSGQTVSNMMNNWTSVKGYPLVTITHESYDPITKEMTIHVQQSVFLISGSNETDNRLWLIPLSVNSNGKIHRFLFGDKNATFKFPFEDAPGSFYKLNHNCNGFYRTKYPAQALARIKNALIRNINALDTEDRLGVINDMFAVATANCGDFGNEPNSNTVVDALELLSAFQKEDDYNVHLEMSSSLLLVKECFYQIPQVINKLHSIAELVFQEAINRLGVIFCEDDQFLVEMDRALAISTLASAKDKQIVTMLCKIVQEIKPEKMPSSLRGIALRTFLQNSNAPNADFDMMVNIMTSCKSVDIRQSVMGALGAINSLDVTRRLLGMLIDDNFVKSQEIMLCLSAIVSHNPCAGAKELLWEWMVTNWDLLHEKLSSSNILLKRLVLLCAAGRLGREFIDTVRNWSLAKHCTNENDKQKLLKQVQGAASGIEQSLERISIKTDWFERDSARLLQWANKV